MGRLGLFDYLCNSLFFSPLWGRIGDHYGRKKILISSGFGLASSLFLMGFVTDVWQLFTLRLFTGVFTGFIATSQAYIATQTPKEIAGRVLGTLQTGNYRKFNGTSVRWYARRCCWIRCNLSINVLSHLDFCDSPVLPPRNLGWNLSQ